MSPVVFPKLTGRLSGRNQSDSQVAPSALPL